MSSQGVNPFLPSYEYIPDPEPKLFNDRVYIYGSHDRFNGVSFCLNDYVSYSASIDNLNDWRYEGIIYKLSEEPQKGFGPLNAMFAPDVIKGLDGRYYLYYTYSYSGYVSVAVSTSPAGEYKFLDYVRYLDGTKYGDKNEPLQFDPGIFIDDDKRIYLYTGFGAKKLPKIIFGNKKAAKEGAMVTELYSDMVTIKTPYKYITKTIHNSKNTSFYGHEFFEAPTMRKIKNKYYFIYSSILGHELCYAISDKPDEGFIYGGTLVSNADIGISKKAKNYPGNNHGGLLTLDDKHYIFYHRQTNRNSFSRQACVEEIKLVDGKFIQAEMTSQGLNGEALKAKGIHQAFIACNLYSSKKMNFYKVFKRRSKYHAYFTQFGKDRNENPNQHIANFSKYTTAGFKYFNFDLEDEISINIFGKAKGEIIVSLDSDDNVVARIPIYPTKKVSKFKASLMKIKGIYPLFFRFEGKGSFRFFDFEIK